MRLDGVRIGVRDVDDTLVRYATVLGIGSVALARDHHRFQLERGAVEIVAGEPGIQAILFAPDADGDDAWPRDTDSYHGVRVVIAPAPVVTSPVVTPDPASAIDHVVVFTPRPERAIALWRDRLGLRLAFDREFPERKVRLIFFRSGGVTLELACALPVPEETDGADRLYGISYRVPNLDARRAALVAAGFDVSEARRGNKAGTRVASVRSGTNEVPTLLLENTPG
jgi:catechol 2,3-dioxygenase-like lactoylglutathione lyase family enzyme